MVFLLPSGSVFRLSLAGSSPCIPCRRSFGFQGTVLNLAIKKSPHNNLNLTILSGMALVRVRYVAIRKLKTCSDSCGSRAGTLSKYVILNCWNRLPQKSSRVNKSFESTPLSAACKKKQGKLWQKERELDGASPLDKATTAKKFHSHPQTIFIPVCRMPLQFERSRAIMPL